MLNYDCLYTAQTAALPEAQQCSEECRQIHDRVAEYCGESDSYTSAAGLVADHDAMMGVLAMQMSCATLSCEPRALGSAFCGVLSGMAESDDEGTASMVSIGCDGTVQLLGVLLPAFDAIDLPYRATECMAALGQDPVIGQVKARDICACAVHCPGETRFVDAQPTSDECEAGYYQAREVEEIETTKVVSSAAPQPLPKGLRLALVAAVVASAGFDLVW